jgi:FkbM family methyltransferase
MRLYSREGIFAVLGELLFYLSSPVISLYEAATWWWYRTRGRESFTVLGHQIGILPKDSGISRELALYRTHEPLATQLLLKTLTPGMNVVDVGSNIGYYALLEARSIGPQGRVIAIEPVQENARQLDRNIAANNYDNILVHHLAIANRNGTATINISAKSNWHSLAPPPWPSTKRQVAVSTLDSLLKQLSPQRVDLLRMDIEGYEVVVLEGMLWVLETYHPRLLIELHPHIIGHQAILDYLSCLKHLDYEVEWVIEQERDVPIRWRFLKPENPTMSGLMKDPRIWEDPRALTVLFSRRFASSCARPECQVVPDSSRELRSDNHRVSP